MPGTRGTDNSRSYHDDVGVLTDLSALPIGLLAEDLQASIPAVRS